MSQLFLSILALAFVTWGGKYFFMLYYIGKKKEEINKLQARTAVLRMLLKAKLKRKAAQMQEQYKDDKDFLQSITAKLDLLVTFNFMRSSDFEEVLRILTSISEAVDSFTAKKNPTETQTNLNVESDKPTPEFNRWTQLFKYDKGNLYIIKEMVETSLDLRKLVEAFNLEQEKKEHQMLMPDILNIEGFEALREIVHRDQEKLKALKENKKQKKLLNQDPEVDVAETTASVADASKAA